MVRHVSQQAFLNILSLRHIGAVCPKPAKPATITISSPHILPTCSSFRAEFVEKLVDKPVCFRFHEAQMLRNIHRNMLLRAGAFPRP